ncbi:MAG TPA: GTP pyrophosphokinase, partial [Burkholderiaceae bacterium]|nr:GTP pyrophosphokinase [Burkholderiaceae bacterium]
PADVVLEAHARPGLLRDVSEVFARDRLNVVAVRTLSRAGIAQMHFTVEVPDVASLQRALGSVRGVAGVLCCHRR